MIEDAITKPSEEERKELAEQIGEKLAEAEQCLWDAVARLEEARDLFGDAGVRRIGSAMNGYVIPHLKSWIEDDSQCGGFQDAHRELAKLTGEKCHGCDEFVKTHPVQTDDGIIHLCDDCDEE